MTKKIKGREYLYAYETKWVSGRPRNIYVDYLGPKEALTGRQVAEKIKELEEENKDKG